MLLWLVVAYLAISISIGLFAATKVHNARDYITAGRHLPMMVVVAMVFATWFGAETVLGISATFLEEGMIGLISDPLGASLCLVLFGLLFARPLYRMNLLTLGDFFRERYNRPTELVMSQWPSWRGRSGGWRARSVPIVHARRSHSPPS